MEDVKANGAMDYISHCIQQITGLKGELVEQYDLSLLNPDERVQVRIDKNNAPKEMVERFAYQMAGGAIFPPIVVTRDARIVDGNTRTKARRQRDERYAAAIVVPINLDDEPEKRPLLELLGLTLNNDNGKALDKDERIKMMELMIDAGRSDQEISWAVGFPMQTVMNHRKEKIATRKLDELGISMRKFKAPQLRKLGETAITALDDESYGNLAQLAADSAMTVGDLATTATSLRQMESLEARRDRLARERDARAQQIADHARNLHVHPPLARQLRDALGGLLAKAPDDAFVERNPEYEEAHLEFLDAVIERLGTIRQAQHARIGNGSAVYQQPGSSEEQPQA